MIVNPMNYLSPTPKAIQAVADNIIMEHIGYERLSNQQRADKVAKYIPTFDPIQMESELVNPKPRYQQPTTSQIIKEMPPDDEEILQFKQHEAMLTTTKMISNKKKNRSDLNQKPDLVEFVLNSRTKRLERYLEKTTLTQIETPSDVHQQRVNSIPDGETLPNRKLQEVIQKYQSDVVTNKPEFVNKQSKY